MKASLFFLCLLLLFSCKSIKHLSGHTYSYRSENRTLKLIFENDTICKVQNRFYCEDVDPEYQVITFVCRYKRKSDYIYLENIDKTLSKDSIIYYIPPQNSKKCSFLNIEGRKRRSETFIGGRYAMPYKKYGIVPNITNEKLHIIGNKITFYKNTSTGSIGYTFDRVSGLMFLKAMRKSPTY